MASSAGASGAAASTLLRGDGASAAAGADKPEPPPPRWTHKHTSQAISATSGATSFRVRASSRRSAAGFVAPACAVEVGRLVGWGLSGEGENR